MLIKFTVLCMYTFFVGYFITWLIYRIKHKQFWGSDIQTKIHMWVPIFMVVMLLSLQIIWLTMIITSFIICGIILDYANNRPYKDKLITWFYMTVVVFGMIVLSVLSIKNVSAFLAVWYMSVTSDVVAYFVGTLIGRHHLPRIINQQKSWEGVVGQLVGACFGWAKLVVVIVGIPFSLGLLVGLGTIVGDLTNSFVKRKNGFKDWSNNIPGHGGFLDRLSSLSFASLFVCAVLLIK